MIYKNLNHHLINLIFIQLFLFVNRIVHGQFTPRPHIGITAVFINNKIYFIGGENPEMSVDKYSDFFYYDNEAGSWVDLRHQGVIIPYSRWHVANVGGVNQDLIFVIGGAINNSNLVYQFSTKTNAVKTPTIQGKTPPRRRDIISASYKGRIYMFGGRTVSTDKVSTFFNNFDILNTNTMTWEVGSLVNAPTSSDLYTATLVNGVLYYIGGIRQSVTADDFVEMSSIYLYDIASDVWFLKTATSIGSNALPQRRAGHTAVLVDRKIFIYGGLLFVTGTGSEDATPSEPTIASLDIDTLEWSEPQLENINAQKIDDNDIPKLVYHTATLLNNTRMFIAFGNLVNVVPRLYNPDYYTFDLGQPKIQWQKLSSDGISKTNPTSQTNPTTPDTLPNTTQMNTPSNASSGSPDYSFSSNKPAIIGLSVGLAVIGLGAIAAFIFIYRYVKRKHQDNRSDVIETPSDDMNRYETPK